jgi:small-conductance mechanosensitive channel/CRP-like cAMP-binding protein
VSVTSLVRAEMAAAIAAALLLGLILLVVRRRDRANVRNALLLLAVCAFFEAIDGFVVSMGGRTAAALLADVASVLVGIVLIRLTMILLMRALLPLVNLHPASIVEDLATVALVLGWGLVWLRFSGVDLASLVATSAVITAVVAFSMQETLGNVLGGVLLQLDQSISIGDWVRIDDVTGRVVEIGWRHTAVETRNRETVMVPNSWLMKNRFTVIGSRSDPEPRWRRWIYLNVDLSANASQVCEVLERCVTESSIANVAGNPRPSAVLLDIGNGYGRYALRYWLIDPMHDDATDSRVRAHAVAALERYGMRLGSPREERLLIKDNEAHRESARAAERVRRLQALRGVEIFSALSDAERDVLADHLVYAPFVAGDTITKQGAEAHWLYLMISGVADIWVDAADGRRLVAKLGTGEVFGEMALLTGEPRRATVTAETDVVCYRLDKSGFESVIHGRPDIAAGMSKILARRDAELQAKREAAGAIAKAMHHDDILKRIRSFFALEK